MVSLTIEVAHKLPQNIQIKPQLLSATSRNDWVCSLCSLADYNESFFNDSEVDINSTTTDLLSTAENTQVDIRQLRLNNKKQCIIAKLNINSLPNIFVEIRSFPNTQVHVDEYNLFRRDRTKGACGIAVYIRNTIVASGKKQNGKQLESIMFDLQIGHRNFVLISAYKHPSMDNITFTSELTTLLDDAFRTTENVICIGDLKLQYS